MRTRVAKEFRWEMAHRLPYHSGGCQNLHGHSYSAWVELEGEPDPQGMVLDYLELARLMQPIVQELDHAFLCDESDALMCEFFRQHPHFKVVYVPFATTAENIAAYIARRLARELSRYSNLCRLRVRVQETERTFAEVQLELPLGDSPTTP